MFCKTHWFRCVMNLWYLMWHNDKTGVCFKNMQNFKLDINKLSTHRRCQCPGKFSDWVWVIRIDFLRSKFGINEIILFLPFMVSKCYGINTVLCMWPSLRCLSWLWPAYTGLDMPDLKITFTWFCNQEHHNPPRKNYWYKKEHMKGQSSNFKAPSCQDQVTCLVDILSTLMWLCNKGCSAVCKGWKCS
jgi:hypothetical protein